MIGVTHGRDARAVENVRKHLANELELRCHFLNERVVVRVLPCCRCHQHWRSFDLARKVKYESLTAQSPIYHRLPIASEAFVTAASSPNIRGAFALLPVAQQF